MTNAWLSAVYRLLLLEPPTRSVSSLISTTGSLPTRAVTSRTSGRRWRTGRFNGIGLNTGHYGEEHLLNMADDTASGKYERSWRKPPELRFGESFMRHDRPASEGHPGMNTATASVHSNRNGTNTACQSHFNTRYKTGIRLFYCIAGRCWRSPEQRGISMTIVDACTLKAMHTGFGIHQIAETQLYHHDCSSLRQTGTMANVARTELIYNLQPARIRFALSRHITYSPCSTCESQRQ